MRQWLVSGHEVYVLNKQAWFFRENDRLTLKRVKHVPRLVSS